MNDNLIVRQGASFTNWKNGSLTLDGSRQRLSNTDLAIREVNIYVPTTNSNDVYVGGDNISSDNASIVLNATNQNISVKINNLKNVFVTGTASEKIKYTYVV